MLGCKLKFIQVIQDVKASDTWYGVEIEGKWISCRNSKLGRVKQ
jgi:hypothetical protein